jgi:hypothetical protein
VRKCAESKDVESQAVRMQLSTRMMDYNVRKLDGALCYMGRGSLKLEIGNKIREWAKLVTLDLQMTMKRWEGRLTCVLKGPVKHRHICGTYGC